MRLVVQKFGGTSVANAERIMAAARRAIRAKQAGNQVIVVVSARGDTTDELIELAREISEQPPAREMDMLLSTGEQISIALMAMAIQTLGETAISFTGAQVGIVTDSTHTKARIKSISTARMRQALDEGQIVIVAGFQGIDENYNITTLGRGGSDTTAVALAAVMKHDAAQPGNGDVDCEIYTDVDGVYTTDPRIVPEARKMDAISYDEMLELASVGAGVMHSRSIEFAKKFDVPVQVRSLVQRRRGHLDRAGGGLDARRGRLRRRHGPRRGPRRRSTACRTSRASAIASSPPSPSSNIVVDMIAQNVGSGGRAAIGFTVLAQRAAGRPWHVLRPLAAELGATRRVRRGGQQGVDRRHRHADAHRRGRADVRGPGGRERQHEDDHDRRHQDFRAGRTQADGVKALRAVHQAFGLDQPRPGAGTARRHGQPASSSAVPAARWRRSPAATWPP